MKTMTALFLGSLSAFLVTAHGQKEDISSNAIFDEGRHVFTDRAFMERETVFTRHLNFLQVKEDAQPSGPRSEGSLKANVAGKRIICHPQRDAGLTMLFQFEKDGTLKGARLKEGKLQVAERSDSMPSMISRPTSNMARSSGS